MQTNTKPILTAKQHRLLAGLAEGLSQKDAAREAGVHPVSASIIMRRPDFREELFRARAEANAKLLNRLPSLVDQALDALEWEMRSLSERRLRAAKITLDLAAKVFAEPEDVVVKFGDSEDRGNIYAAKQEITFEIPID
jgi:hypothetical protein